MSRIYSSRNHEFASRLRWAAIAGLVLLVSSAMLVALPSQQRGAQPAPRESQKSFATPQEAIQAVIDAAERNDTAALLQLFGSSGKDIVESGDAAQDKTDRAEFVRLAKEKLNVEPNPGNPDHVTFSIGEQDALFPVPLVRRSGKWEFDSARGKIEILAHRIGSNELNAVDVCRGFVEAQMEYAAYDRDADGILEYAQKIVSSPGKKDGLYWEGEPGNLVPKSFAGAALAQEEAGKAVPYHGYRFHILKAQGPDAAGGALNYVVNGKMIGGFALVAWPNEYGVSGIKTFIVSHQGVVYEKDLGTNTSVLARQMIQFNPDKTWKKFELE